MLAVAAAIHRGPHVIIMNGEPRAVYSLDSNELKRLFAEQGYNPDRISWRKAIRMWGDSALWGELVPRENILMDRTSTGWSVVFLTLSFSDLSRLRQFAQEQNVKALPWEEELIKDQRMAVCQSA